MQAMLLEVAGFKFGDLPEWALKTVKAVPQNKISQMMARAVAADTLEEWLKP